MTRRRIAIATALAVAASSLAGGDAEAQSSKRTKAKAGNKAKIERTVPKPAPAATVNIDSIKPLVWAVSGYRTEVYGPLLARIEANLKAADVATRDEVLGMMSKLTLNGRNFVNVSNASLYAVGIPQEMAFHIWDGSSNKTLLVSQGQIMLRKGKLDRRYMWFYDSAGDVLLLDGMAFKSDAPISSVADKDARLSFFSFPGTVKMDPLQLMQRAKSQAERQAVDLGGYIAVTPLDRDFCTLMAKSGKAISDNDFATARQRMTEQRESPIPGIKEAKVDLNDSPTNIVKDLKKIWDVLTPYERHMVVAYFVAAENAVASDVRNSPSFRIYSTQLEGKLSPTVISGLVQKIKLTLGSDFDRNAFELRFGKASLFFNFDNLAFLRQWRRDCGAVTADTLAAGGAGFQELVAGAMGLDREFDGVRGLVAKRLYAYVATDGQDQRNLASKVARGFIAALVYGQKKYEVRDGRSIVVTDAKREPNKPFVELHDGLFETAYAIYLYEQSRGKPDGAQAYGGIDYAGARNITRSLMKSLDAEGVFTHRVPTDVAVSYHIKEIMAAFKSGGGLGSIFAAGSSADYLVKTRQFFEFAYDNATYTDKGSGETKKIPLLGFIANMLAVSMGDGELGKGAYAPKAVDLFGVQRLDGKVTNEEQQAKDTAYSIEDITAAMTKLKAAAAGPQKAAVEQLAAILSKSFWAQKGETANPEAFFSGPATPKP